jgi:His/Glu/Gln/Arg/opine family amino acid ABC transporter permease subunit
MPYRFHFEIVSANAALLLKGLGYTILLSLMTLVIASLLGVVVAVLRSRRIPILTPALGVYVEFFRGTPPLVQLVWMYYCLPILTGINLPDLVAVLLALSLYTGAFLAEVFRAGIQGVDRGQVQAALSVGMTRGQAMRRIVLPQAAYRMIPNVGNVFITTIKASALCSVLGFPELMYQAQSIQAVYFRPLETLTAVALLYFALTWSTSQLLGLVERRLAWVRRR